MIVAVGEAASFAIAVRVTPHCQSAPGRLSPFHPPNLAGGYSFLEPAPSKRFDAFVVRSIPHNEDGNVSFFICSGWMA